jgi:hypothetical protein
MHLQKCAAFMRRMRRSYVIFPSRSDALLVGDYLAWALFRLVLKAKNRALIRHLPVLPKKEPLTTSYRLSKAEHRNFCNETEYIGSYPTTIALPSENSV